MGFRMQIKVPAVFVVSHDPEVLAGLEQVLKGHYEVTVFKDGTAALDAAAKAPPSVIVVDESIKPKGGAEFLASRRKTSETRDIPCVLTGRTGRRLNEKFMVEDLDGYANWPIRNPDEIREEIGRMVSRAVEDKWEKLPTVERKALKMTVEQYQGISDAIQSGEPIDYDDAKESCLPLVDAVKSNSHHQLLQAVQGHHNYTYVHSMRVATLLTLFGSGIGASQTDMEILATGGLLHDVGKIVTPQEILNKPGKLDDNEWPIMQNHVVESDHLLHASPEVKKGAIIIAAQHHEKLDGSGYPHGLKGAELNELARMSAICDIFGALTDERSYKPPFPSEKAFAILESMDKGIDQKLLKVFRNIFDSTAEKAA